MKTWTLINVILFLPLLLCGQPNTFNDSLYITALEKYSIEIDSFYSVYGAQRAENSTIYLEFTELINQIPDSVLNRPIVVLTGENYKKIFRKNKNRLTTVRLFPMETKDELIEITLIPYHSQLKRTGIKHRKRLFQELSDWTKVYFKYDRTEKIWKFEHTENGGI